MWRANLYLDIALASFAIECFALAYKHGLFLEVDEVGNIWLGDGESGECDRVCGWHTAYKKINDLIKKKELKN